MGVFEDMRSDIDSLMASRQLDALLVLGGEEFSSIRYYLSRGADITQGYILKIKAADPLLIVNSMEIEEAAKSGFPVKTFGDYGLYELQRQYPDDPLAVQIAFFTRILETAGIEFGRIGLYGTGNLSEFIEFIRRVDRELPQYEFVGENGADLFREAMLTKDDEEMARLRSVAERTNTVMQATWDFISGHHVEQDQVVNAAGEALTIGQVKSFVLKALLEKGLEDTGMIFAQGRDAGFPHSRGEAEDVLRPGQSIVFDLFPREIGGGYHHDMTRTWSLGYASPHVQKAYDEVMTAFDLSIEMYGLNKPTYLMQEAVQNYFEAQGHETSRSHPGTLEGYVHSLGHGVGINIHELPRISHLSQEDVFQIGNCITIEPGLYYPEKGFGVRVEDMFIVNKRGELESLTPFRKDLVLPLS